MSDMGVNIIIKAIDRATAPIRRITRQMEQITAPARRVSQAVGRVTGAAGSLGLKLTALGGGLGYLFKTQLLDTASAFERFRTVLETIEGSSGRAESAMEWISQFASTTPYELEKVTEAYVQLRSYGLEPTNGLLRTLGDTSAAMGKDLGQAVEAIADAVTGENERLKTFGIVARRQGKQFVYEYSANGEQLKAVADANNRAMIQSTLTAIWNEKYSGAMDKLSGTWEGMMSNLGDQWTQFKNLIMQAGAFDFLKGQLSGLLETINAMAASGELRALAEEFGVNLVAGLKEAFAAIRAIVEVMGTVGRSIAWLADLVGGWKVLLIGLAAIMAGPLLISLGGLIAAVWLLGTALMATPIGWFLAGLAAIVGAGGLVWENWDWLSEKAGELWGRFGNLVALIPGFSGLVFVAKQIVQNWDAVTLKFSELWDWIDKIGGAWDGLGGLFGGGGSAAPTGSPARIAGRGGMAERLQGKVQIEVTTANGASAKVLGVSTANRNVDLAVEQGLVMGGGW